jgi:hypothetical protein
MCSVTVSSGVLAGKLSCPSGGQPSSPARVNVCVSVPVLAVTVTGPVSASGNGHSADHLPVGLPKSPGSWRPGAWKVTVIVAVEGKEACAVR